MPQHPQYDDNAHNDFETLCNLISTMVTFGLMHEDGAIEIESSMKKLYITDKMVKEYAEENYYDLDDLDTIRDEIMSETYLEEFIPDDADGQQQFVQIFRTAISTMMHSDFYGCVYDAIKAEKENM